MSREHFGITLGESKYGYKLNRENFAIVNNKSSLGNGRIYDDEWCKEKYNRCMQNYDINMQRLFSLNSQDFENEISKFYQKNKEELSHYLNTNLTEKKLLKLIEDLGKEFSLREDTIYSLNDYFEKLTTEVNNSSKLTTEIKKEIKSKNISVAKNAKLITLYFLSNIENNKKEKKALSLFFSKQYMEALFLSFIGAHYGE